MAQSTTNNNHQKGDARPLKEKEMNTARLEHANITVSNPKETADLLCRVFGWHIRWEGPSRMGGHTVHVGSDDDYLALYTPGTVDAPADEHDSTSGGLNHIAVVVGDLDEAQSVIESEGLQAFNHGDYEPGRRFYFNNPDGIEFEVVSYE